MLSCILIIYMSACTRASRHLTTEGSGETTFYNCLCFVRGKEYCQHSLQRSLLENVEHFYGIFHLNLPSAVRINSF